MLLKTIYSQSYRKSKRALQGYSSKTGMWSQTGQVHLLDAQANKAETASVTEGRTIMRQQEGCRWGLCLLVGLSITVCMLQSPGWWRDRAYRKTPRFIPALPRLLDQPSASAPSTTFLGKYVAARRSVPYTFSSAALSWTRPLRHHLLSFGKSRHSHAPKVSASRITVSTTKIHNSDAKINEAGLFLELIVI